VASGYNDIGFALAAGARHALLFWSGMPTFCVPLRCCDRRRHSRWQEFRRWRGNVYTPPLPPSADNRASIARV